MPPVVRVKLPTDSPLSDAIGSVAARLHVDLDVQAASMSAEVGDVLLPDDAPIWQVEAAMLRSLGPRHLLFLCVANSARSQLAEGLARAVAPDEMRISSAGSVPTRVRPQAIAALAEHGIDITHHESTGIDDVERPVDAVITLCAEEVCPVWLGTAWRLHWGLPDPAGASENPEEEMEAFRGVRDELIRRFDVLFG